MAFSTTLTSSSLDQQNFFETTLKTQVTDGTDTNIYLTTLPSPSEGFLTIEPTNGDKKEIIFYTSKGADFVTVPSAADGRGVGGTTAQGHDRSVVVRQSGVAEYYRALRDGYALASGAVTTEKIADEAVIENKVANNAVTEAKIANGAVSTDKVKAEAFGTWTITFGGFSVAPIVDTARYIQIGKLVYCVVNTSGGTSNAITFTITLPVAAKSGASIGYVTVYDNGTLLGTPGRIVSSAGSTTASVFKDAAATAWTASGTKNLVGSFFYEAA
jgi:hypothetical protein